MFLTSYLFSQSHFVVEKIKDRKSTQKIINNEEKRKISTFSKEKIANFIEFTQINSFGSNINLVLSTKRYGKIKVGHGLV